MLCLMTTSCAGRLSSTEPACISAWARGGRRCVTYGWSSQWARPTATCTTTSGCHTLSWVKTRGQSRHSMHQSKPTRPTRPQSRCASPRAPSAIERATAPPCHHRHHSSAHLNAPAWCLRVQNRANLYRRQGMLREAEADYTKAIEIQPSSVKALINRGALLREQNLTVRAHRDLCVCSTNQRRPIASRAFPHHFPSACAGLADERIT